MDTDGQRCVLLFIGSDLCLSVSICGFKLLVVVSSQLSVVARQSVVSSQWSVAACRSICGKAQLFRCGLEMMLRLAARSSRRQSLRSSGGSSLPEKLSFSA